MAALLGRYHTGCGQQINCSLLESQVAILSTIASAYLNGGLLGGRLGTAHESIVPYQMFATADSNIVVGALNDKQFQELCHALGLRDLSSDSRFATNPLRVQHRADLIPILEMSFKGRKTEEWLTRLKATGLPFGPVNSLADVFEDAQVQACEMVQRVPMPTMSGSITLPGFAAKLSETPCHVYRPPPLLGQHSRDVLKEVLGLDDAAISALVKTGALGSHG
jgi:succinate--hydroxymethylglutarate CoA-transferase